MVDKPASITQPFVQLKTRWADPWDTEAHLRPIRAERLVGPGIPTATFEYLYGEIDEGHGDDFQAVPWLFDLIGSYIRIARRNTVNPYSGAPTAIWTGIVTAQRETPAADELTEPAGDQIPIVARGMAYLLARAAVHDSVVEESNAGVRIARRLTFNENHARGLTRLGGNRSADKYANTETPSRRTSYVFSADGDTWTHRDIIEYLLTWFAPPTFDWLLDPNVTGYDNLDHDAGVIDPPATVAAGLSRHADRRRGHAWLIGIATASGRDYCNIEIVPTFQGDVGVGDSKLSGAAVTVSVSADADLAARPQIEIQDSVEHEYDRIEVVGQPLLLMATFRADAGQIDPAWDSVLDTAYAAETTRHARTHEKYAHLYRSFILPDGDVPPGPGVNEAGVPLGTLYATNYPTGKSFSKRLPILPTELYESGPAEYQPMLVAAQVTPPGATDPIWVPLDGLSAVDPSWRNLSVRPLDGRLGIHIYATPNHLTALNQYTPQDFDTNLPIFDYATLLMTAAWYSDERLRVTVDLPDRSPDYVRTLRIAVPDAACWIRLKNTVIAIKDGAITPLPYKILRNDAKQLQAIAAQARAWYQRPRRSLVARYPALDFDDTLGFLVTHVSDGGQSLEIETIITRKAWDFTTATTTIQTDHSELDFAAAFAMGAARGPGPMPTGGGPSIDRPELGPPQDPAAMQIARLAAQAPAATAGFPAFASGTPVIDGTNKRWAYPITEVAKTSTGHDGWTVKAGGRTGTAYNLAEVPNSDSGMAGTGIDQDNLTADEYAFALMPIPYIAANPRPLWIHPIPIGDAVEYWFSADNSPDGECT